jgi:shikimate dehydrogenase
MYGIIGYPLSQTFSPDYFNAKFERLGLKDSYHKFPLATIDELKAVLQSHPELKGLNVTIPYKEAVIPFLDELHDTAQEIGAVNTVKIRDGKLKGYNTDVTGFRDSLQPLLQPQHRQALILGTGGASKAVAYALQQLHVAYRFVSRTPAAGEFSYAMLDRKTIEEHLLIVNTTPLGMTPDMDNAPAIPYEYLGPSHLLYDLIYNPAETLFLQRGKVQGAAIKNGYDMLIGQAEAAWNIWQEAD